MVLAMTTNRTKTRAAFLLAAGLLAGAALISGVNLASATPAPDLHCEGHNVAPNVKDESGSDDNDFVPVAGTVICVKAGTGNTGIVVADGETTLREYLFAAGIVDGSGEQGRDVSYWVIYPPTTTTVPEVTTTVPETTTTVEVTTTVPETTTTVPETTTTVPEVTTTVPETTTTTVEVTTTVPEVTTTVPEVTTTVPETTSTPETTVPDDSSRLGSLPVTGSDTAWLVVGATALVALGLLILGLRRED